jgi:hypothetical protein
MSKPKVKPKLDISKFPLIAITEVMDMPSGDSGAISMSDGTMRQTRTVEDLFEYKAGHLDTHDTYKDWDLDWKQERPVYIEGGTFFNGHHRATHAHRVGLLFLHYTNDAQIGWERDLWGRLDKLPSIT